MATQLLLDAGIPPLAKVLGVSGPNWLCVGSQAFSGMGSAGMTGILMCFSVASVGWTWFYLCG